MTTLTITGAATLPIPVAFLSRLIPSNDGGSVIEVFQRDTSRSFVFDIVDSDGNGVANLMPIGSISQGGGKYLPTQGPISPVLGSAGSYAYYPTADEVSVLGSLNMVFIATPYMPVKIEATVLQRYGHR